MTVFARSLSALRALTISEIIMTSTKRARRRWRDDVTRDRIAILAAPLTLNDWVIHIKAPTVTLSVSVTRLETHVSRIGRQRLTIDRSTRVSAQERSAQILFV